MRQVDWLWWALECKTPGQQLLEQAPRLPEVEALRGVPQDPVHHPEGCALTHTAHVCDAARRILLRDRPDDEEWLVVMLAAACHDLGKATTTRFHEEKRRWVAYGHDLAGVPLARALLERCGVHDRITERVCALTRCHMAHCQKGFTRKAAVRLLDRLTPASLQQLLRLMEADTWGRPPLQGGLPPAIDELVAQLSEGMNGSCCSASCCR